MAEAELARFIDRFTVEYVRVYAHPIERVWRAISDPAELACGSSPARSSFAPTADTSSA